MSVTREIDAAKDELEGRLDDLESGYNDVRSAAEDLVESVDNAINELTEKLEEMEDYEDKLVFDPTVPDFGVLLSMIEAAKDMATLLQKEHAKLAADRDGLLQKNRSLTENIRLISDRNAELEGQHG